MPDVRLRAAAEQDLDLLLSFSAAQFGREVAIGYLDSLEAAFALLSRHPGAGTIFRRGNVQVHSFPCRSHRIFYTVEEGVLWIVRILHKSRNSERIIREWVNR